MTPLEFVATTVVVLAAFGFLGFLIIVAKETRNG